MGVNQFEMQDEEPVELQSIDEAEVAAQMDRVRALRAARDGGAVEAALRSVREAAAGEGNLLYPMRDALKARATLGEVSDALREVFGTYTPSR